jgi:ubiquinone/menaquinone biosynthesis C-methylase UbiE
MEQQKFRDEARQEFIRERIAHWDQVARTWDSKVKASRYYHQRLAEIYRSLVTPNLRILELGCGQGDLLAAVNPEVGVGVDFSSEMIKRGKEKYPSLQFIHGDAHDFKCDGKFDVIILSDLVNDLWDVQKVIRNMRGYCTPRTRVIINFYSRMWEFPLLVSEKLTLSRPVLLQNWLTVDDVRNLLQLENFNFIQAKTDIIWPIKTPLIDTICNKILVRFWPFKIIALTNFIISRPSPLQRQTRESEPDVSVIIPVRNEEGHVPQYFSRIPQMGKSTEIVFVEGHSKDNTYEAVKREITKHPDWKTQLHKQIGEGKGDAVRLGFEKATGDVLMILDGDLTVSPEDLPLFYNVIVSGKGEFISGVRLVYPMDKKAMRFWNFLGNKFFSLAFSWLLGQPIKDTLCGTKVLWKSDYRIIAANRSYFGDFDPFGDFDLLFGASRLNLKMIEIPIRYRERTYGETNIQRWKHGWLLLKMAALAAKKLKFI